jgi:hypothetical protein
VLWLALILHPHIVFDPGCVVRFNRRRVRLETNAKLARDLGVLGTPAIVIGERLIPSAV